MRTNFLDTVTMFLICPFDIRRLFNTHWIWDNSDNDCNLHHFCIRTNHAFVRYFPDMHGMKMLYMTFSLPKFYNQCNNNTFNVTGYNNVTFMNILEAELGTVLDISQLSTSLADWQPSRIDLFRMTRINPINRKEYHYGYSRLIYRGVKSHTYLNTNYLPSSLHSKQPCVLLRSYNKTIEQQDKQSLLSWNLPSVVEREHEKLMLEMDIPTDQYRHEFSLRRNFIKRFCNKYNFPLNMETIMDERFQKMLLNELVISRGLHYNILSKKEYRRLMKQIFPTAHTQQLALKLAESIRNKKSAPMSVSQIYRIKRELNSFYISTATTNFVSIKGLELLH